MIEFDEYKQELKSLSLVLSELVEAMHLDKLRERNEELENYSTEPEFWQDTERAQKVQQEMSQLKRKISLLDDLQLEREELELLCEMGSETDDPDIAKETEERLQEFEINLERTRLETYFIGDHDSANAIITLHAGAGGTEAADWTSMLYRMYSRWAEQHEFQLEVLDYISAEEAGIKTVSFKVTGDNAYGLLSSEMGVHRLVRISPFDSTGRRHTSFSSVEVMPELDDSIEINIKTEDLRIDYYRSSGAGGQHVNKTSSAVRLTHLPTGVVVACQNERSQVQNKDMAMRMLRSKLYTLALQAQMDRIEDLKGNQLDIAWGSQIRSYVFCPYTQVKDLRTDYQTSDVSGVMDGEIDPFITAWLAQRVLSKSQKSEENK